MTKIVIPDTPEVARLRAENDRLRALLSEARDDLADAVDHEYPWGIRERYPVMEAKYKRDMDLCWRIDAALSTPTDAKGGPR